MRHGRGEKGLDGSDHHVEQLCAEVEEILSLCLAAANNRRLQDLTLSRVIAVQGAARLRVEVIPERTLDWQGLEECYRALERAKPWLRRQLAEELSRKRVPELEFGFVESRELEDRGASSLEVTPDDARASSLEVTPDD